MNKTLLIAKKEFHDLVSSPAIVLIIVVYSLLLLGDFFDFLRAMNYSSFTTYQSWMPSSRLSGIIVSYGSLVAIVIGFASITSEINSRAINTLLEKPVYRDTIINGKLIGIAACLTCIYLTTVVILMILYFMFVPGFINDFNMFLASLPAVLLFALLCTVFYLVLSMFFTIAIKNPFLALLSSLLVWLFLETILPTGGFGNNIALIFNQLVGTSLHTNEMEINNFIVGLSPGMMGYVIFKRYMDLSILFNSCGVDLFKMALYNFVTLILCYIGFIRRDVQ